MVFHSRIGTLEGRNILHKNQLQIILKETDAVINNRSLVYADDDIDSNIILGHFSTLNPKIGLPELKYDKNDPDFDLYESSADIVLNMWKKG